MPYELKDLQSYPVNFSWKWGGPGGAEGEGTESLVFAPHSVVPLFKQVTFKKNIETGMTFSASATYADGAVPLPPGTTAQIGRWVINSIPVDVATLVPGEKPALKIGCKLDDSGIVLISRAEKEWNEEIEYEEEQEVPLSAEELAASAPEIPPAAASEEKTPSGDAAAAPEAAAPAPAPAAEAKQPKTKKVKVTKKRTVAKSAKLEVTPHTSSLSAEKVRRFQEQEREMRAHDRLVVETAAEKNKVESYIYEAREKLAESWAKFATEGEKEKLSQLLNDSESWLYEQGESQGKAVYAARLAELRLLGDPIELRAREAEERAPAADELQTSAQQWLAWSNGHDAAFDHISAEDKTVVRNKATSALDWLKDALEKQNALAPTDKPHVLSADIIARRHNLDKEASAIKSKPKPKPAAPKDAPKADPPKEKPQADNKEAEKEAEKETPKEEEAKAEPMDTTPN